MPVVRTDRLSGGWAIGVRSRDYQISRMGSLPHFLTDGSPQAPAARQKSAINAGDKQY